MVESKYYHRGYSCMAGRKGMKHFGAAIIDEVLEMQRQGITQREIAEHFELRDRMVVEQLIKRHNRKQRQIEAGYIPRKKGRPRKEERSIEEQKDEHIKRLRMENELLRAFLSEAERR